MTVDYDDQVRTLAGCGGLPTRMVITHQLGEDGYCLACPPMLVDSEPFTRCPIRDLATRALYVQAQQQVERHGNPLPATERSEEAGSYRWI